MSGIQQIFTDFVDQWFTALTTTPEPEKTLDFVVLDLPENNPILNVNNYRKIREKGLDPDFTIRVYHSGDAPEFSEIREGVLSSLQEHISDEYTENPTRTALGTALFMGPFATVFYGAIGALIGTIVEAFGVPGASNGGLIIGGALGLTCGPTAYWVGKDGSKLINQDIDKNVEPLLPVLETVDENRVEYITDPTVKRLEMLIGAGEKAEGFEEFQRLKPTVDQLYFKYQPKEESFFLKTESYTTITHLRAHLKP